MDRMCVRIGPADNMDGDDDVDGSFGVVEEDDDDDDIVVVVDSSVVYNTGNGDDAFFPGGPNT